MRGDIDHLDEQIDRLRNGGTLTENEVKILCDKVSSVCALPGMICLCICVGSIGIYGLE